MRNILLIFLTYAFCISLSAQTINLPKFTAISTSGNVEVELVTGANPKAEYSILQGDENELVIEVKKSVLYVKITKNNKFYEKNRTKAKVKIYYQELNSISLSAGSNLVNTGVLETSELSISSSSGSSIDLDVNVKKLSSSSSSGANQKLKGSATSVSYSSSSGSAINAKNLTAQNVSASASSGASIKLLVNKSLSATASSGAGISYYGDATDVSVNSSSGGQIKRKSED